MQEGVRAAVGRLLRQLRSRRRLSLVQVEQLTTEFGHRIPRSRLSQLERGDVPVTLDDVQVLCRVHGIGIVDLFLEVLAAAPPGRFPSEWNADRLFEEARRLYDEGQVLEAAWAFDAAAARAEDAERRAFFLVSAGHCYDRYGSLPLATRRVEQALDLLDDGSDAAWRATAKLAVLLARAGARIRARVFLDRVLDRLARRRRRDALQAYLQGAAATALGELGDIGRAVTLGRRAARTFARLGRSDMALLKLAGAARLAARDGKASVARSLLGELENLLAGARQEYAVALARLASGIVNMAAGETAEARAALGDAWRRATAHGFHGLAREAAEELARLAERTGDAAAARRWRKQARELPGEGEAVPLELLAGPPGPERPHRSEGRA